MKTSLPSYNTLETRDKNDLLKSLKRFYILTTAGAERFEHL
jgi:hypothetical protein